MKINDEQLANVISALESELNAANEKAKPSMLAKAAGDMPPPESTDDSALSPSPDAGAASPAPEAASAPLDPSAGGAPAPDAGAAGGDPAADQATTPEALQAEYAQLSPEELDMHLQAAMAAKEALSAASASPAGTPPGAPGAPAASPAPAGPPAPAMKKELNSAKDAIGGMIKSEIAAMTSLFKSEIEALKAQIAEKDAKLTGQDEDLQNLTKAVTYVLETPVRKAVTSIEQLQKSEPKKNYTITEVKSLINKVIPTLSKAERDDVLGYYSGTVKLEKLRPILDKASK